MFYYAELDKNNIVKGVSDLAGEIDKANMIRLEFYEANLIGKQYVNGDFVEVETNCYSAQPEQSQQEPSSVEMAIIEGLIAISERLDRLEGVS